MRERRIGSGLSQRCCSSWLRASCSHRRLPPPASVMWLLSNSNSGVERARAHRSQPLRLTARSKRNPLAPRPRRPPRAPRSTPHQPPRPHRHPRSTARRRDHRPAAARGPGARTPAAPPPCATARAAHHPAPRPTPDPRPHPSPDLSQHLVGDLLEVKVDIRVRAARDPRAVDRHHPPLHQAGLITASTHP